MVHKMFILLMIFKEEHVVKLEMLTEPDIAEPLGGIVTEIDRRLQLEVSDTNK